MELIWEFMVCMEKYLSRYGIPCDGRLWASWEQSWEQCFLREYHISCLSHVACGAHHDGQLCAGSQMPGQRENKQAGGPCIRMASIEDCKRGWRRVL